PMIATGTGFAMAIPIVQKAVVGAVAAPEIGKASGTLSTIRQLGGVFGVAIAVAIFALVGSRTTPQTFARGFAAANGMLGLLSLAGAIAALWLSGKPVGNDARTHRKAASEADLPPKYYQRNTNALEG
ncbi:MAG: hypothetical protein J2P54_20255, partial [Bradyrhizobiaceae bacterium]|nr:hypothetical protein [Bradyrhizobiaceae bacterium]